MMVAAFTTRTPNATMKSTARMAIRFMTLPPGGLTWHVAQLPAVRSTLPRHRRRALTNFKHDQVVDRWSQAGCRGDDNRRRSEDTVCSDARQLAASPRGSGHRHV